MKWCAICTADIHDEPVRQPLGKGGAMVNVCQSCDEDAPVTRCSERGYVSPGSALGARTAAAKVKGKASDVRPGQGNETVVARTPGFVLVRVPCRDADGRPRDANEARATLAHQPWAASMRYLSTSGFGGRAGLGGFHLFERPGERVMADIGDQLADLEQHRVKP